MIMSPLKLSSATVGRCQFGPRAPKFCNISLRIGTSYHQVHVVPTAMVSKILKSKWQDMCRMATTKEKQKPVQASLQKVL